ncbi:hypothetical protein PCASD_01254 [Puccinia coronata f. sp. avenae]|uniref:Uncharacterized protein n=1 Tax=Puccinia coronata f. sp. avenae TaxID=200324 RepID=A0A2N5VJ17_9BASI|nr:hypothetical protein PCASD_01254 [Puccinia coronata f. sp. avenae]
MISTRHFQSFLICISIILCIAYSSQSLPTSHTLHKRMQSLGEAASLGRDVASAGGSALQTTQPLKFAQDLASERNPELFSRKPGPDLAASHPTSSLPPQPPTEPTWEELLDQGAHPPTSDPPPPSANPTGFNTPRKLSGGISSYFQSVKKSRAQSLETGRHEL